MAGLLGVSAVAVRAFAADTNRGCSTPIKLSVAVAPDIADAVTEAADRWAGANPKVNGQCVRVTVTATASTDVAKIIAARAGARMPGSSETPVPPQESDVPAVWIPESIAWITRTRAMDRNAFDAATPSIAMSPVVLGTQEAFATSTLAGKPSLSAVELAALLKKNGKDGVAFAMADPARDAGALAGAAVLRDLLAPSAEKASAAVAAYRSMAVSPDTAQLLKTVKAKTVVPVTEQAIVAYNANVNSPSVPLNVIPLEHTFSLDYPLAVISGKSLGVLRAAQRFRVALTGPEYHNILAREGFRAPDGTLSAGLQLEHGVTGDAVAPHPLNDAARVDEVLNYWSSARVPSRVLSLIDVTSSMKTPMKVAGAASTRMEVLRKTAIAGLSLFNDTSEMGLWTFGSTNKELVGIAPLAAAQRATLTTAVTGATAGATDTCALYDAVLAAYTAMRDGYRAGVSNTVVIFTDGSNNTKSGLTSEQLRVALEKASDPTKPVRVVLLGLGPDTDMQQLNAIAGYIGGKAFAVQDPAQINDIFMQALLRG
jgi:hypothetical protein